MLRTTLQALLFVGTLSFHADITMAQNADQTALELRQLCVNAKETQVRTDSCKALRMMSLKGSENRFLGYYHCGLTYREKVENEGLVGAELKNKAFTPAAWCFDRAIRYYPTRPEPYLALGKLYWRYNVEFPNSRGNHLPTVMEHFTTYIMLRPDDADGYLARSGLNRVLGDFDAALADAQKTIELAPEKPQSYEARGYAYLALQRPVEALADFDRAISLGPVRASLLRGRGLAHMISAAFEQAQADFSRAIAIEGAAADYHWRSVAFEKIGDMEKARLDLEHVLNAAKPRTFRQWQDRLSVLDLWGGEKSGENTPELREVVADCMIKLSCINIWDNDFLNFK